ncbi:MAG: YfbM family protein [Acidobacteriota bacterium]
MSMIGNFLRMSSRKVEALRANPERITKVLYPDEEGDTVMSDDVHLDVEKAWHGIHFLLNGEVWSGTPPLDFIVAGEPIGDVDVGYGPARGFLADQVRAIATALEPITPEVLRSRYDAGAPGWAEVYPMHGRADDGALDYLVSYYESLRDFVIETAELGAGMIVYVN